MKQIGNVIISDSVWNAKFACDIEKCKGKCCQYGDLGTKIVLVAGGEDVGLGERVKKCCDDLVSIPLAGKTPSLNVSVSLGIALYEVLRQNSFFGKNI